MSRKWSGYKLERSKKYSHGGGPELIFRFAKRLYNGKESDDRLRNHDIASFLHALNLKNAAYFLNLECADDNSLQSFFVDSGYTSTQLT